MVHSSTLNRDLKRKAKVAFANEQAKLLAPHIKKHLKKTNNFFAAKSGHNIYKTYNTEFDHSEIGLPYIPEIFFSIDNRLAYPRNHSRGIVEPIDLLIVRKNFSPSNQYINLWLSNNANEYYLLAQTKHLYLFKRNEALFRRASWIDKSAELVKSDETVPFLARLAGVGPQ